MGSPDLVEFGYADRRVIRKLHEAAALRKLPTADVHPRGLGRSIVQHGYFTESMMTETDTNRTMQRYSKLRADARPMLRSPFPDWISFAYVSLEDQGIAESYIQRWGGFPSSYAPQRRRTFAMGRLAAHRAIEALGHGSIAPVRRNDDGSPDWPSGLIGSISHTADLAVAAVAEERHAGGLGVDIEDVWRTPVNHSGHIEGLVADAMERAWIAGDRSRLILLFSAKEAIFKALYPRHRAFFGFEAAHLERSSEGFIATLRAALGHWSAGVQLHVSSYIVGSLVISSVLLPPLSGSSGPCRVVRPSPDPPHPRDGNRRG